MLYCRLWPLRLYRMFQHYLIKDNIFEKKNPSIIKFVFSLKSLSKIFFFILRRIELGIVINVCW